MFLIVGLGNPGKEYENTRHNIGFKALELLADRFDIELNKLKFKGIYGEGRIARKKVILLKPQTYMNNSGQAVIELMNFYKIPLENLIVLVDDIDIKPYSLRVKAKGSAGSHNGLKSIIQHTKGNEFPRVKLGVGQNEHGVDLAKYVLSNFPKEDSGYIEELLDKSASAVESILADGIDSAMNKFN